MLYSDMSDMLYIRYANICSIVQYFIHIFYTQYDIIQSISYSISYMVQYLMRNVYIYIYICILISSYSNKSSVRCFFLFNLLCSLHLEVLVPATGRKPYSSWQRHFAKLRSCQGRPGKEPNPLGDFMDFQRFNGISYGI